MSEIITQVGAELRIVANADGTYTAFVGGQQQIFTDIQAAAKWACMVRDGEKR